ncbi:hypothetical protein K437DRAFT_41309 [Tilletiaria anomala UBC 951]|uniref:Uncharacterized protein n=1 Tax=Tilletiaria anomala (strain ATCC 24038 / CBS 436.72 / UBC 951) TaxID=1037660 RepID=A0A066V794_TILAU|nr:uncharacterized protein K437DRAFT_41309 [Tilletiaria anomala UBC 951]KDN37326.1 hypothetical protein K437DRAFT_41309 [Tilletiaria anomala UBC 951]
MRECRTYGRVHPVCSRKGTAQCAEPGEVLRQPYAEDFIERPISGLAVVCVEDGAQPFPKGPARILCAALALGSPDSTDANPAPRHGCYTACLRRSRGQAPSLPQLTNLTRFFLEALYKYTHNVDRASSVGSPRTTPSSPDVRMRLAGPSFPYARSRARRI